MTFYSRKTPRAQRHYYTSTGMYFITINTRNKEYYFGEIDNQKMILNDIGKICENELQIMIKKRPYINIYEYTIMPNHIHILLSIHVRKDDGLPRPNQDCTDKEDVDVSCPDKEDNASVCPYERVNITNQSLGSIIGGLKSAITKKCNEQGLTFARQSRYHDHIIKDEKAYNNIKYYIQNNPSKGEEDVLF